MIKQERKPRTSLPNLANPGPRAIERHQLTGVTGAMCISFPTKDSVHQQSKVDYECWNE